MHAKELGSLTVSAFMLLAVALAGGASDSPSLRTGPEFLQEVAR